MTSVHTFQNGFRVVYQPSEHAIPISSVYLFCNVGSAYETDTVRGASHFVEHMCFKGTEKIKKARNLLLQYNKSGTEFNAFTDKWITGYFFKCDDDTLGYLTTVLSDMVLHSTFPKKEFNKEQHIVVEECLRAQDNPPNLLEDEMERVLCSGSSYEFPVDEIAYHPTATHLTHGRMTEWYHAFYRPSNFLLSIVSSLSFSTILAMIRKTDLVKKEHDPSLPSFALPSPRLSLLPISSGPIRIEYYPKKGITTTCMDIAFRTCPHSSPDKHKLTLLEYVMNGFSGRLFTALRTDRGLTYRSKCKTVYYEHMGYFKIHVQTDPRKLLSGVLPILIDLLMDLKRNGIHPDELQMIKGHIKGNLLLGMESIDALARFNGIESLLSDGSFVPYKDQYTAYFARMTKKQLDDVIRRYFTRENLVIGIMYDHELPKKKIQTICESFH